MKTRHSRSELTGSSLLTNNTRCVGMHRLTSISTPTNLFNCDSCSRPISKGEPAYSCRECLFQQCQSCWFEQSMQESKLNNGLENCLLSREEFDHLQTGDKFDHRDKYGMYSEAVVIQKLGDVVYLRYEHYGGKWNVMVSYKDDPSAFAKYQSISNRHASSVLSDSNIGDHVLFKPSMNTSSEWKEAKIIKMHEMSGQVKVEYKNESNDIMKRWTHLDNLSEVRPLLNDTEQIHCHKANIHHHHFVDQNGSNVIQNGFVQFQNNNDQKDNDQNEGMNPKLKEIAYLKRIAGNAEMALQGNGGLVLRNGTYSVSKFVHNLDPVYKVYLYLYIYGTCCLYLFTNQR